MFEKLRTDSGESCIRQCCGVVYNEETAQYIKLLSEEFAEKMIIGAGTVLLMSRIIPDRLWSFLLSIARIKK